MRREEDGVVLDAQSSQRSGAPRSRTRFLGTRGVPQESVVKYWRVAASLMTGRVKEIGENEEV